MHREEIEIFINATLLILDEIPEDLIVGVVCEEDYLPNHLLWNIEYKFLKEKHILTTNYIYSIREDISFLEELKKLIRLRRTLSLLMLESPKNLIEEKRDNWEKSQAVYNHIPLRKNFSLKIFKNLYKLLIKHNRITKDQSRELISLMMDNNQQTQKIKWRNRESDLRGFLTALINSKISSYDITDLNKFAEKNFICFDKSGKPKIIKHHIFRTYQNKNSFYQALEFWESQMLHLPRH